MTFYEAAIEVLRRQGRPLHYKKITELAIQEELLSHVGKTPEVTMGARLNQEIKKESDSMIDRTRPGVYKLKDDVLERLNAEARKREEEERKRIEEEQRKARERREAKRASQREKEERKGKSREKRSPKRSRSRSRDEKTEVAIDRGEPAHLEEGPVRLSGIAEAAFTVLGEQDHTPMALGELAEEIFDRKLVKFHTHDPELTVKAALATDNQLRVARGHRPLFTHVEDDRWGLSEWGMSESMLAKEQTILSLSEQLRQEAIEALGDEMIDMKGEALEHIALTLLERQGYTNIKVSKRSSNGDVFFSADWRQGLADVRVCIQVVHDHERSIDEDDVTALRGTLHHYAASEGVIIHLGEITRKAVDESREERVAPITLIDRRSFVELLVRNGLGVKQYNTPIVLVDDAFIERLRN
jgi:hypothetical protein